MDFLHLFRAGGFMMYPLILCSLVVVAIFIERFRYYLSNRSHVDELSREIPKYLEKRDYEGLKTLLQQDGGIPASVVLAGVEHMNLKVDQTSLIEGAASHAAGLLKNYLNSLCSHRRCGRSPGMHGHRPFCGYHCPHCVYLSFPAGEPFCF